MCHLRYLHADHGRFRATAENESARLPAAHYFYIRSRQRQRQGLCARAWSGWFSVKTFRRTFFDGIDSQNHAATIGRQENEQNRKLIVKNFNACRDGGIG